MERKRNRPRPLLLVLLFFLHITAARGEVLVVYPEAPSPYREVFEQLLIGLARTAGEPLKRKTITATTTAADFQTWKDDNNNPSTMVLLGQHALDLNAKSRPDKRYSTVVGGVVAWPGQVRWPGVSLAIDPALYLQTLRELMPKLQTVVVYYDARDEPWIAEVRKAAGANPRVEAIAVNNAGEVARKLERTFQTLDPKTTALWFGRDTIAYDTEALYPYILRQSWYRRIAVVADAITYVRRGFLFAYYPNYTDIGAELGELVREVKTAGTGTSVRLTRAGQLTLNIRTAQNLSLDVPLSLTQRAKPLFPEP